MHSAYHDSITRCILIYFLFYSQILMYSVATYFYIICYFSYMLLCCNIALISTAYDIAFLFNIALHAGI